MPLVQKLWGSAGLKGWRVAQYTNEGAPYIIQAWLEWESKDHADAGLKSSDGGNIFADVPKFSDASPIVLSGEEVGSATW
ncbi:hypothetical protein E0Z10_g362 [Xylaria hypoxylon]|uniref:ABM domain-containing protein n=1 Tax=Xylaria hypoxylon TaxID=37992 RepID=A0A4Z0Z9B1_9PEZI|nr:hypothetical protein E0Z10_g362 [Xylaria hypoxylon]